mgnify:CR=1 FL=1
MIKKNNKYIIGIDPGVNTGYAVWSRVTKTMLVCETMPIHKAMAKIEKAIELYDDKNMLLVKVEDARKRKWFGNAGREQLQGAGSIKRDCKIWEDFLTDLKIDFELVAPKNNKTKLDAKKFKEITKWEAQTNEHSRDAAMLVYNF